MIAGDKFYSKKLKRFVNPGEDIYLEELKLHLEEKIAFYKNGGCGTGGCNIEEMILRNELNKLNSLFY